MVGTFRQTSIKSDADAAVLGLFLFLSLWAIAFRYGSFKRCFICSKPTPAIELNGNTLGNTSG